VISLVLGVVSYLLQFSGPIVISKVLEVLDSDEPDVRQGLIYVSVLVVCYLLRTVFFQHQMHYANLSCLQSINAVNSLIYSKILRLSSSSRKYLETGNIMNHINVDVGSLWLFNFVSTNLVSAPVMVIVGIFLLAFQVGWIGLSAPVIFGAGMVIQQMLMKMGFQTRKDQLFWSDKRAKCVN
jgi:ABC-type transport system involved in cytochrome bd biosynthesis fused ATPase/permease subunit